MSAAGKWFTRRRGDAEEKRAANLGALCVFARTIQPRCQWMLKHIQHDGAGYAMRLGAIRQIFAAPPTPFVSSAVETP